MIPFFFFHIHEVGMGNDTAITLLLVGAALVLVLLLCLALGCGRRRRGDLECGGGGTCVEPGQHAGSARRPGDAWAWRHAWSARPAAGGGDDGHSCGSSTDSDQSLSTAQQVHAPTSMYLQSRLHSVV